MFHIFPLETVACSLTPTVSVAELRLSLMNSEAKSFINGGWKKSKLYLSCNVTFSSCSLSSIRKAYATNRDDLLVKRMQLWKAEVSISLNPRCFGHVENMTMQRGNVRATLLMSMCLAISCYFLAWAVSQFGGTIYSIGFVFSDSGNTVFQTWLHRME